MYVMCEENRGCKCLALSCSFYIEKRGIFCFIARIVRLVRSIYIYDKNGWTIIERVEGKKRRAMMIKLAVAANIIVY